MHRERIKTTIERYGLEFFGIAKLGIDEINFERFESWLFDKRHASMKWLENYSHIRRDSSQLDSQAVWSILVGVPYFAGDRYVFEPKSPKQKESFKTMTIKGFNLENFDEPLNEKAAADRTQFADQADCAHLSKIGASHSRNHFAASQLNQGSGERAPFTRVAQYARYQDYHSFTKKVGGLISLDLKKSLDVSGVSYWRTVSDSVPLLERSIHDRFSSAFIGKNTMLIHPKKGSYFLLMEILTDFPLAETVQSSKSLARSESGGCGGCRRCQVYCPTGALDVDYQIDSRRCLSYLTIEHRGEIELKYWIHFKKYWYGCDICQLVCPYNRKAQAKSPMLARQDVERDLAQVAMMSQKEYEDWFGGTPMTRAKRNGLRRNALIALAATNDSRLDSMIEQLSKDDDPVIRLTIANIPAFRKEFLHANRR